MSPDEIDSIKSPPCKNETVKAFVCSVHDGDTCTVVYKINDLVPFKINIRFANIDTPEVHTTNTLEKKAALLVTDYVKSLIDQKTVDIEIVDWDKFGGRVLGNILVPNTSVCLNDLLIDKKLAKQYNGKTKKEVWLDEELEDIVNFLEK